MKVDKNYAGRYGILQNEICDDIDFELKRIGKDFVPEDDTDIEFMSYEVIDNLEIELIRANGMVKTSNDYDEKLEDSFRTLVGEDKISLMDAISFLSDLRGYPSVTE